MIGIVAFTWVFVNELPPAPDATTGGTLAATTTTQPDDSSSSTTSTQSPASTSTTTTTIPPEIVQFVLSADTVGAEADGFATEAQEINDTWESGRNFTLALNSLRDFASRTTDFSESVGTIEVPDTLVPVWDPVQTSAADMVLAADDMVRGLQAPDTGQIRRAALADFLAAAADLSLAIADAKAAATG